MLNPATLFPRPTAMERPKDTGQHAAYCIVNDNVRQGWIDSMRRKIDAYETSELAHRELAYRHYAAATAKQAEILKRCGVEEQGK